MFWTRRRIVLAALCAAVLLAPGWSGSLEPTAHGNVLVAARASSSAQVFGVALEGEAGTWHAQYVGRSLPVVLHDMGLGGALTAVVPPDFAAHIPRGAERADGYFRVETAWHWPWWWPGGGVAWTAPGG